MENLYRYEEEFRDGIATVDAEGKRIWVYPKKPKGNYHNARIIVTIILLTLLFAGSFVTINDQPFLLLNIFERKFVILGNVFWPQDFFLLALTLITFFIFIILFTVTFGRVWCGWACPQTLFMEMVFRKIEYWIEGDASKQRKLDNGPWTGEKIWKKGSKHAIFLIISLLISHTVMAYLIGIDQVREVVSKPPGDNFSGFMGIMVFTGIFYWVFAYFREQACTVVCPYGRLQGVLLGKDSIVVAFDYSRGEPRGRLKKNQIEEGKGDCIDCKLCVHACPTGIDIRHGTQLECVNCTACMDACDDVMTKVNRPKGLIRYSSDNAIRDGVTRLFTPRVVGYSVVLLVVVSLLSFFILTRSDIETTILRVPGILYQKTDNEMISNLYNVHFINKTFDPITLELKLEGIPGATIERIGGNEIIIEGGDKLEGVFMVKIPENKVKGVNSEIDLGLYSGGVKLDDLEINFMGPAKMK
ncbi:MAG: cytochrome c oxidase accessory protein CcoG [Bacteroidetes bacterium]|nr:cytochrome c oxidase accessory protein CcoG [Bacteroidota bacterium]MDA1119138.1 cytochrome c oxidase accessory protein CcoG [Bacteroidota bacterium]